MHAPKHIHNHIQHSDGKQNDNHISASQQSTNQSYNFSSKLQKASHAIKSIYIIWVQ